MEAAMEQNVDPDSFLSRAILAAFPEAIRLTYQSLPSNQSQTGPAAAAALAVTMARALTREMQQPSATRDGVGSARHLLSRA